MTNAVLSRLEVSSLGSPLEGHLRQWTLVAGACSKFASISHADSEVLDRQCYARATVFSVPCTYCNKTSEPYSDMEDSAQWGKALARRRLA